MFINTTGIVLREVKYNDNSKILTVLTDTEGKLTVSAHRAYSKTSKLAAATGFPVYSHMTITKRKDRYTLTEAQTIEQFTGLRDDLNCLALAAYIAELTEATADEDALNPQLLPLCLNTLYALSEKMKAPGFVKPVFELRLLALAGYKPILYPIEDLKNSADTGDKDEGTLYLTEGSFYAAQYVLSCNPKKLFSFKLDEKALRELTSKTEEYLLTHLDRNFKTLEYYKKCLTNTGQ